MLAAIENYIIMSLAQHHLKLILLMTGTIGSTPLSLLEPARVWRHICFILALPTCHACHAAILFAPPQTADTCPEHFKLVTLKYRMFQYKQ